MSNDTENEQNNLLSEKLFLLTNIFASLPNMSGRLLPLVSSSNNINVFFNFINYNNDTSDSISLQTKLELIEILTKLFQMNNNLIFLFVKKCRSNIKSFFDPLIDIYLNEYTKDKNKKIIEDLLIILVDNISINKNVIEYIYQKLSQYFRKDSKIILTNDIFLKYLNLLDIFYTCSLTDISKQNNENIDKINNDIVTDDTKKKIKNYIYFNGFNNKMELKLNKNSYNINSDFPTLEFGFTFIFWLKLEKTLIDSYFLLHKNDNTFINLININFAGHQIKLQLVDCDNILLIIDDNIKSNYINFSNDFKYNEWNSFAFILYPRKSTLSSLIKTTTFKLFINQHMFNFYIDLKNFVNHLEKKIISITLFENLIGKSTSVLYFSFSIDEEKLISLLNTMGETGFYKLKYLYKFLLSNEKDFSKYSKNNKYMDKFKSNVNKIIDINFKEQNIKNLMCFLCPFAYNNKTNSIDDIFGNYIGELTPENGVNTYTNNHKNIKYLGGIDNLLPIAELMLLTQNKNKKNHQKEKEYINYDLLDSNFLNENTFLKYITIIKKILLGNKLNLSDANAHKFFSSLELFLEKFNSSIYTNPILNVFLEIGKETFGSDENIEDNFVNMILLNEKIFSKFSEEVQQKLWEGVHQFFTSDYLKMKESIPMSKICLLLRFYDSKKYDKFCCQKHAELFKPNESNEIKEINKDINYEIDIMKPDMNTKVNKLFETIQLYLEKFPDEEDNVNLFKLLCLDLSSCLQIKIIQAYKKYFQNKRKNGDIKSKVLKNLLKNNLFDIYEYILSIALLDVRVELIEFLKILMKSYSSEIEEYCNKKHFKISKFFEFVGNNLLPLDIKVELNDIKNSDNNDINIDLIDEREETKCSTKFYTNEQNKKKEIYNYIYNYYDGKSKNYLINYFNDKIFEKDIESMWKILNEWLLESNKTEEINSKSSTHLKSNSCIINFCIQFASKINPFYIDSLLIIIYSFLKNSSLDNKEQLYTNEMLFPWIIETIFFFYDTKNWEYFSDIEIIQLIQQHSIELLKEFIIAQRNKLENEIMMNYIFEYAYYLKTKNNSENNLNTIGAIIRLILSQIIECSQWDINIITKFCFQFMIFFKNSEQIYNNKELMESYLYQDEDNLFKALTEKRKKSLLKKNTQKIEQKTENQNSQNRQNSSNNVLDFIYKEEDSNLIINNDGDNLKSDKDNLNILSSSINNTKLLIPDYFFKSLFLNQNDDKSKTKLIQIWKDFDLFNYIIDIYESNIWGISNLCKNIKIKFKGKLSNVAQELIKEYSTNSKYKNILLKDLYKCLNFAQEEHNIQKIKERIKYSEKKSAKDINNKSIDMNKLNNFSSKDEENFKFEEDEEESIKKRSKTKERTNDKKKDKNKDKRMDKSMDKTREKGKVKFKDKNIGKDNKEKNEEGNAYSDINILKINLILLCIAIELTKNDKEKELLINKYEHFIFFCIICSLNTSQSEKFHEFVQINLRDLIGYGLLFLKETNKEKYKEFINVVIVPIFEDIISEKTKLLKNLFSSSKSEIYENSSLRELFILYEEANSPSINNKEFCDFINSKTKMGRKSSIMEKTLNNIIYSIINQDKEDINKDTNYIYDIIYEQSGKSKEGKKSFVIFVGDSSKLTRHVINSIVIYYIEDKRKKNMNKKTKIRFKNIETNINYYDLKYFYNFGSNNKTKIDKKMIYEKTRLTNVINSLIPFFENQIKKYSTSSVIEDKKRYNIYKLNKKKLFSWRGFWSDKYLFFKHPEYLKYKIKNHLTKEMTKIILTPILDMDYYMPSFSKFESKKLFNEGDYKYKVNLDMEEILGEDDSNEIQENDELKCLKSKNNFYGFNYLESIYKLSYENLWESYRNYNEQKFNFENNSIANITRNISISTSYEIYQSYFPANSINDGEDNAYNCCYVKLTHHIRGILQLEKTKIKIIFNLDETKENFEKDYDDPTFDKDLGTCFGSTFKNKKSDNDKISLEISYKLIKYFFIRYYYYQETGLEIYTTNNKNYYFTFKNNTDLYRVKAELLKIGNFREIKCDDFKGKKVLGYEQITNNSKKKNYHVIDKMKEWRKYEISTLEYLMWINIYGGRSFNDLTQYPIFPWIITDYISDELNINDEKCERNLFSPIGMLEINDKSITRKETFIDTYSLIKNDLKENYTDFNYNEYLKKGDEYYDYYKTKKSKIKISDNNNEKNDNDTNDAIVELNQLPSFYGSHYSNPTYVTHFMTRIFPFAFVSIEIQGDKFDDPNRMFISIGRTFESTSTLKDDIRELIPEFYLLPEMLQNNNNLNLAQGKTDADNNKIVINDVDLPPWSNDDACNFILEKRTFLEKSSLKINKWIDIIFGNYQRGEKAEEINNIFQAQTYEKMVKLDSIKDPDMRNALLRLVEVGITPIQIFDSDSKPKYDKKTFLQTNSLYAKSKGKTLDEAENLICLFIESQKIENYSVKNYENKKLSYNKEYKQIIEPRISKIVCINYKLLEVFINNNYYYTINLQNYDTKGTIEESNLFKIENNSSKFAPNLHVIDNLNTFVISKKGNYIFKAGFWDNRIEYNSISLSSKNEPVCKAFYPLYSGPIVKMVLSEEENILVCGTKTGNLLCYQLDKNIDFDEPYIINAHNDEITSISINSTLHLCASTSMDGYIMIYTLPDFCVIRAIQISKNISEADISEEEFIFANNIFLSSSPLPCFIIFISSKKLFIIYDINGKYIGEVEESEDTKKINDPIIFKNLEFQEFLIYGTDDGYVKIRNFPNMKMINMIKPFEGQEVKTLELSLDKRYCFTWSHGNKIAVIKDSSVTGVDMKDNNIDKEKKINEQNEEDIDY